MLLLIQIVTAIYDVFFGCIQGVLGGFLISINIIFVLAVIVIFARAVGKLVVTVLLVAVLQHAGVDTLAVLRNLAQAAINLLLGRTLHQQVPPATARLQLVRFFYPFAPFLILNHEVLGTSCGELDKLLEDRHLAGFLRDDGHGDLVIGVARHRAL